ncbi:MAG TPA: coenzyme F420-0:L-glutamate ligase [Beutenbergiaceae bacterium]|nr:coenzyme F420-0:L-glutamate ligase [Beutenbergiaceae bacterium]
MTVIVKALEGLPTFARGDDIAAIITPALGHLTWPDGSVGPRAGDMVVIASKIVARAEGRLIAAKDREEAIEAETVREVARRENPDGTVMRIVETHHGLVLAAAGVDTSNVPPGTALLLPEDPDASARAIRRGIYARFAMPMGVIITDTVGRPWRRGIADIAIGAAGIQPLHDLRGETDDAGATLHATIRNIADEIAAAADLAKGKIGGRPVAVVRGVEEHVLEVEGPGAKAIHRSAEEDLFRRGGA